MILKVFSVYDSKAEAYLPPFVSQNRAVAIRSFTAAAQDSNHNFCRHAADYTLFEIAEFDDVAGQLTPLKAHVNLGCALMFAAPAVDPRQTAFEEFQRKLDPEATFDPPVIHGSEDATFS